MEKEERLRYSRNLMLDGIGEEGQKKLMASSVLVVGCGALGSLSSLYLAGSGVGRIGVLDFDTVDISNLQRQISFSEKNVGQRKTEVLAEKLQHLNKLIQVETFDTFLSKTNAREIIKNFDLVLEGSDNPETKYLVCDICLELNKPCVVAGVSGWTAQVTTFIPKHTTYRDIFPNPHSSGGFTPCSLGGVLGPLPGIAASVQACEAVKVLTGTGRPLVDRMLVIDALNMDFRTLSF